MASTPSCRASGDTTDPARLDVGTAIAAAHTLGRGAVGLAKDATYTAIGLGILGVASAQQRRRQIERLLRR